MPLSTSALGPAIPVEGLQLQVDNGSSPDSFTTIANIVDFAMPLTAKTVDVTNVGDAWVRKIPTLLDMGKITFGIKYVMEEPTHRNSGTSTTAAGLRALFKNSWLRNWNVIYADGNNSTDSFPAYVTGFSESGKVGDVWDAKIELTNQGPPQLV